MRLDLFLEHRSEVAAVATVLNRHGVVTERLGVITNQLNLVKRKNKLTHPR